MALDFKLHIFFGGILTLWLFSLKFKSIPVFLILLTLTLSKELYDHFFTLGHYYPACLDHHLLDIYYSLLPFFVLFIPVALIVHGNSKTKAEKF